MIIHPKAEFIIEMQVWCIRVDKKSFMIKPQAKNNIWIYFNENIENIMDEISIFHTIFTKQLFNMSMKCFQKRSTFNGLILSHLVLILHH